MARLARTDRPHPNPSPEGEGLYAALPRLHLPPSPSGEGRETWARSALVAAGRGLLALIIALIAPQAVLAQQVITSPAPDSVAVTIYRAPDRRSADAMNLGWLEGYALITEQRTVTLPAGRATVRFEGVAGGMLAESAMITGLPAGVQEKNLDADLLSPRSLFARGFARPALLRRQNNLTGAIIEEPVLIRSAPEGAAIVQTKAGFELAHCGPFLEALTYPEVPPGLTARPTLSFETDSPTGGQVTLTLAYLAWGFDWQANYVVRMKEGGKGAEMTAWVTLASGDPTSFERAETAVIGGKVNREGERKNIAKSATNLYFQCVLQPFDFRGETIQPPPSLEMGFSEIVVTGTRVERSMLMYSPLAVNVVDAAQFKVAEEELGDLKLYRVPMPTTVAANAQKQVALMDQRQVDMAIVYAADVYDDYANQVMQTLRTRNREDEGLGLALPGGPVAIFEPHGGADLLIGEGGITDKAVGEDVEIEMAPATQVVLSLTYPERGKRWQDVELTLTNANPWPVSFEAKIHAQDGNQLTRPTAKLGRKDGADLWTVQVPANGTAKLRYRLKLPKR